MSDTMQRQLAALNKMTTGELVERYAELHGHPCRTRHRAYLIRKIAWRIQANAEGDLSERARKRAAELANDAEVRVMAPKAMVCPPQGGEAISTTRPFSPTQPRDPRLPAPGSAIIRKFKGRAIRVVVLEDDQGFEFDGERYTSLTAVAKKVSGNHINGFRFFHLGGPR
jgi:hypothetical protein